MKTKILIIFVFIGLILVGCSNGGPSNAEAREVIYGVYLREARIIKKTQCELTPKMVEDGFQNVWLVLYKFEGSDKTGGMVLAESDSEEYPWKVYMGMTKNCPEY